MEAIRKGPGTGTEEGTHVTRTVRNEMRNFSCEKLFSAEKVISGKVPNLGEDFNFHSSRKLKRVVRFLENLWSLQ